jgi:hypothetical protein
MADSATGGPGAGRTYIVHYRREDGTEASGQAEPNARGGFSWLAPEDCAAITGIEETGGGGGRDHPGFGGGESASARPGSAPAP